MIKLKERMIIENNDIDNAENVMYQSIDPVRFGLKKMGDRIGIDRFGSNRWQHWSQSRLILDDWKTEPLSIADITALRLEVSQFAYLSACHAADSRSVGLMDEAIHLAGACQLAGFPSVVGTLWQINDIHAASVAKDVYTWMLGGGDKIDVGKVAEAVHRAVRHLRDETRWLPGFSRNVPDDPRLRAPYIHMGI